MNYKNELLNYLKQIYHEKSNEIIIEIERYKKEIIQNKSSMKSKKNYDSLQMYTIYPDGIIYDKSKTPFQNLTHHVKYIKNLGFNAIHILPFLESPMIDKGFDVSNYYNINTKYGSFSHLMELKKKLHENNIIIFI